MIPVDQAGVPSYNELVLVVRDDEARTDGQDLRAFLQALTQRRARGTRRPRGRRRRGLRGEPVARPRKLQLESIKQTLPATVPSEAGKPYGWQSPQAWATFGSLDVLARAAQARPEHAGCRRSPTSSCPGRGSRGASPHAGR